MKVIIAGSRGISDLKEVTLAMFECPFKATEVVSGAARGVDTLGEEWAEKHKIPVTQFPAIWKTNGIFDKSAGYKRNLKMAEYADGLVAIWDGNSKGTKHMIDIAKSKGLLVHVHLIWEA